ncbi:EamA family transporter [Thiohalorhabdus methylotrophus]|uniref:EamA family transporter n=1 Tax=Thiohalorhabdus methylotrophus TaxID=3242694 RepID=A0ABV4TV09_9GAMM
MNWIFLAVLTAFFYGAYNVFIKVASGHINQIVGALVLQIVAALVGGVILGYLRFTHASLEVSSKGFLFAVLAGLFVGLAEITSFFVFSRGVPAAIGIPIIIGGSVAFGALMGVFFLKEHFQWVHVLGLLMVTGGVVLLTSQ